MNKSYFIQTFSIFCVISLSCSADIFSTVYIYTLRSWGPYSALSLNAGQEMSVTERVQLDTDMINGFPDAQCQGSSTYQFNCHGYTFKAGAYWIQNSSIANEWTLGAPTYASYYPMWATLGTTWSGSIYSKLEDFIDLNLSGPYCTWGPASEPTHSGRVTHVEIDGNGVKQVYGVSKWGKGPWMYHSFKNGVNASPYSGTLEFYRCFNQQPLP